MACRGRAGVSRAHPSERVALLLPGIRVVVVAVALPEARRVRRCESSIPRSHFALFQKYMPGITRRRGHPCSGVSGSPSAWVQSMAPSRSRNAAGTFAVKPCSACAIAYCALARCPARSLIADHGTPVSSASKRLQRVTQWMSWITVTVGSSASSSHVSVTGVSTSPHTLKSQPSSPGEYDATSPAWSTGHLSVRYWPGGSRPGS